MEVRAAVIIVIVLGSLLGGCGQANVYDISRGEAYAKLIQLKGGTPSVIDVEGVRKDIYGTPGGSVTWVTDYAHSYYECTAYLTPEGPARTSVNVGCSDKCAREVRYSGRDRGRSGGGGPDCVAGRRVSPRGTQPLHRTGGLGA